MKDLTTKEKVGHAFWTNLKLIKVVFDNYDHIQDFETLTKLYADYKEDEFYKDHPSTYRLTKKEAERLVLICETTRNSRYNYTLFKSESRQNPDNHIDRILQTTELDVDRS